MADEALLPTMSDDYEEGVEVEEVEEEEERPHSIRTPLAREKWSGSQRNYGATAQRPHRGGPSGSSDDDDDAQDGVKAIEAVSMTWTNWGLVLAYCRCVVEMSNTLRLARVVYVLAD